jgi:hypothetical protein
VVFQGKTTEQVAAELCTLRFSGFANVSAHMCGPHRPHSGPDQSILISKALFSLFFRQQGCVQLYLLTRAHFPAREFTFEDTGSA